MDIVRGYKVRLYPTRSQERELLRHIGACRFIYNHFLEKKTSLYKESGERLYRKAMSAELTKLRQENEWLRICRDPLEQSIRKLDQSFTNFFKKRARYPDFKKKSSPYQSISKSRDWTVQENRLHFVKGLEIRFRGNLPKPEATLTISRDAAGHWYASTTAVERVTQALLKGTIGLDLGLNHLVTTSDGEKFDNPRVLNGLLDRLRRDSKALSRTKKGSKTRAKRRLTLARTYRKVERVRTNGIHHVTKAITSKNHAVIAVEDLNVQGMMKNRRLSRSIADASWGELVRQLTYKQAWRGGVVVKVDRFFPSSKTCSACGYLLKELPLSARDWKCLGCGAEHDRDINAAKMIKQAGERLGVEASPRPKKLRLRRANSKSGE